MVKGSFFAIWVLQHVFDGSSAVRAMKLFVCCPADGSSAVPERERNAYVKAASQWLLLNGDAVFKDVPSKKWQRWHKQINVVACGKRNKEGYVYDEESVLLAGRASVAMDAIERGKIG